MPVISTKYIRRPPSSSTRCCPGNRDSARDCLRPFFQVFVTLLPFLSHIYPAVSRLLPAFCRVRCQGRRPIISAAERTQTASFCFFIYKPSQFTIDNVYSPTCCAFAHFPSCGDCIDAYNALFCSRYVQSIIYLIYILTGDVGNLQGDLSSIYLLFGRGRSKGLTRQSMTDIIRYAFQLNRFSGQTDCVLVRNGLWITPIIKAADTLFRGLRLIFERIKFYVDCRWMERL